MNEAVRKLFAALPQGGGNSPGDASARQLIGELFAHGPAAVADVVELLKPAETGGDAQARLALHNLATFAAGQDEAKRKAFADALGAALVKTQPADVKAFIIRQLQLCGGPEVVPAMSGFLLDEALGEPACLALAAIRKGAGAPLVAALDKAQGHLKLVIVQTLGVLREASAAKHLRTCAGDGDANLRLTAAWALANIGASEDAPRLMELVRREEGYNRAKALDAAFVMAQRLSESGKTSERTQLLKDLRSAGENTYAGEAAQRLLEAAAK